MIKKLKLHWQVLICMVLGGTIGYFLNPYSEYIEDPTVLKQVFEPPSDIEHWYYYDTDSSRDSIFKGSNNTKISHKIIKSFYSVMEFLGIVFIRLLKMIIIPLIGALFNIYALFLIIPLGFLFKKSK